MQSGTDKRRHKNRSREARSPTELDINVGPSQVSRPRLIRSKVHTDLAFTTSPWQFTVLADYMITRAQLPSSNDPSQPLLIPDSLGSRAKVILSCSQNRSLSIAMRHQLE